MFFLDCSFLSRTDLKSNFSLQLQDLTHPYKQLGCLFWLKPTLLFTQTQYSRQSGVCLRLYGSPFPSVATIYSSGLNLCSLPFVKQDSAGAFVGLERYLTLPLSSGGMWQPACWKVVQQWSTSKADMVNYFCKALNTEGGEGGWKWECWPLWRSSSAGVTLERDCATTKKKRAENHCISHNQRGLTKSVYIHNFAIFFSPFKGNLLSAAKWP